MLKLGTSMVHRRLKAAEARGILKHIFDPTRLSAATKLRVESFALDDEFVDLLACLEPHTGVRVSRIHVFDASGARGFDDMAEIFAQRCAPTMASLVLGCQRVAVAHGSTVQCIARALRREQIRAPGLEIYPASGDLQTYNTKRTTAFNVAEELANSCGARAPERFEFYPFATPSEPSVIHWIPEYRKLFTGREPLIQRVDALFTTASSEGRIFGLSQGVFEGVAREMLSLDPSVIDEIVVGDLCGALIPKTPLSHEAKEQIRQLQSIWTGLHREHIISLVKHAKKVNKPGVVLIAFGEHKKAVVSRALELGWVNTLLIDLALARALKEELIPRKMAASALKKGRVTRAGHG